MSDAETVESYCQGFWGALERSGNAEHAALARRFWEGMKGVKHDTETVEQMRDGLERLALKSASAWCDSDPEKALALVLLANEVRAQRGAGWSATCTARLDEREDERIQRAKKEAALLAPTFAEARVGRELVELLDYWRMRDETPEQCLSRLLVEVKTYRELRATGVVP